MKVGRDVLGEGSEACEGGTRPPKLTRPSMCAAESCTGAGCDEETSMALVRSTSVAPTTDAEPSPTLELTSGAASAVGFGFSSCAIPSMAGWRACEYRSIQKLENTW